MGDCSESLSFGRQFHQLEDAGGDVVPDLESEQLAQHPVASNCGTAYVKPGTVEVKCSSKRWRLGLLRPARETGEPSNGGI
jgi:hypothetical protein